MDVTKKRPVWVLVLAAAGLAFLFSRLPGLNLWYMVPPLVVAGALHDGKRFLPVFFSGLLAIAAGLYENRVAVATPAGRLSLFVSVFVPSVLWVAALVWISLDGRPMMRRYLAGSVVCMLVSLALVAKLSQGGEVVEKVNAALEAEFVSFFTPLTQGEEQALAVRTLTELYRSALVVLGGLLGTIMMAMFGINAFVASAIIHTGDQDFSDNIASFHIRDEVIWVFLLLWGLVGIGYFVSWPYLVKAVLFDLAAAVSLLYAVQGFAILLWRSRVKGRPVSAASLFWRIFIIMALLQVVNTLLMCGFTLLGVTETWIQYRKVKENNL